MCRYVKGIVLLSKRFAVMCFLRGLCFFPHGYVKERDMYFYLSGESGFLKSQLKTVEGKTSASVGQH